MTPSRTTLGILLLLTTLCPQVTAQSFNISDQYGDSTSFPISECEKSGGFEIVQEKQYHFAIHDLTKAYSKNCYLNFEYVALRSTQRFTAALKIAVPIEIMRLVGDACNENTIHKYITVGAADESRTQTVEETVDYTTETEQYCVGMMNFHAPGQIVNMTRVAVQQLRSLGTTDQARVNSLEYKIEYQIVRSCPPRTPRIDDFVRLSDGEEKNGRVNSFEQPETFLSDNLWHPHGLRCHYPVDIDTDNWTLVVKFPIPAFYHQTAADGSLFIAWDANKHEINRYNFSRVTKYFTPAWVVDADSPISLTMQYGVLTDSFRDDFQSRWSLDELWRRDPFKAEVRTMAKGNNDETKHLCSSECESNLTEIDFQSIGLDPGFFTVSPCWSKSSKDCLQCRQTRDEDMCVETCVFGRYQHSGVCFDCHKDCAIGTNCGGPDAADCYKKCNETEARLPNSADCVPECPSDLPYADFDETKLTKTRTDDYEEWLDRVCQKSCAPERPDVRSHYGLRVCFLDAAAARERQREAERKTLLKQVLIVLLCCVFCVIVAMGSWAALRKRKKIRKTKKEALKDFFWGEENSAFKGVSNKGHLQQLDADEIELSEVVGQGAFGKVYSAIWRPKGEVGVELPVAVKLLYSSHPSAEKELLEEAAKMASVDCENLLRLVAVCLGEPMMLITKFMVYGAALPFIKQHRDDMTSYQFMEWSRQLANGMAHLESKGIVHRDLAARNVLVESPRLIRISDFGLSKLLDIDKNETSIRTQNTKLPVRWLAKECLTEQLFTHKSDVWAYGVTLWEFYTYGARPYGSHTLEEVRELVIRGRRLVQPPTCSLDLYTVMLKCWMGQAENRISFTELQEWFAANRCHASKYFYPEKRDVPLDDVRTAAKISLGGASSSGSAAPMVPSSSYNGTPTTMENSLGKPQPSKPQYIECRQNDYCPTPKQRLSKCVEPDDEDYMMPISQTNYPDYPEDEDDIRDMSFNDSFTREQLQRAFPQFKPDNFAQASNVVDGGRLARPDRIVGSSSNNSIQSLQSNGMPKSVADSEV